MSRVAITISVASTEPGAAAVLARRLTSMGATVRDVHDVIGVVACEVEVGMLDAVRALPEVEAVEEDRAIRLPPPEDDVQ
mgnify:FL=1